MSSISAILKNNRSLPTSCIGQRASLIVALYSEWDLNPHSRYGQGILSPSCLPIPPSEQVRSSALGGA